MITDWFRDRLQRSGHRRIDHFHGATISALLTTTALLEHLRRHELYHAITLDMDEQSVLRSENMMETIEAQELELGPWTSFRDEETVYFVFRWHEHATWFKLMLG